MNILVTGGSGFIGSALIEYIFSTTKYNILNVDKLTYASYHSFSKKITTNKRYTFKKLDICSNKMSNLLKNFQPDILLHMAAESHVDNSINSPNDFINTNILGTYNLLKTTKEYLGSESKKKSSFKFINFSTDEVYGDLMDQKIRKFSENTRYNPSSPYSASKASADHLVNAWQRTYDLPAITINSSNNYGPRQHHEKLIPLTIKNAISGKKIPIYGNGLQKRDWLYVEDCSRAILKIINNGRVGQCYNIGSRNIINNIDLVKKICKILDKFYPKKLKKNLKSYFDLVKYVKDRPGHDRFYAIEPRKIEKELKWKAKIKMSEGLKTTIQWYIDYYKGHN